ncbi:phage/plasmid primase, P4 family [Lacipirellula limnantheis]|nr:phage/plasmid primase, P4 family [Lacipirellula limnantheis]
MKEADLFDVAPKSRKCRPQVDTVYDYCSADGDLIFQAVRMAPKDFRQRRPDPKAEGKWLWSVKGCPVVPYRLPELLAASESEIVFIVEGEKDAENIAKLGLVSTCNAGGAGKWREQHAKQLPARAVAVLCDNDPPGKAHGEQVAKSLVGKATSIKVIDLPGLPAKGDASDWIAAGGTREQLLAIVDEAPEWGATVVETSDDPEFEVKPDTCTDVANARRFSAAHGHRIRFVYVWNKWLVFTGARWEFDVSGAVMRAAKDVADGIYKEAATCEDHDEQEALVKWAKTSHSRTRLDAMIELAKSEEPIPASHESFDADPWLLNCVNGTVDLRSGSLHPHAACDMLSKSTGVEYPVEAGDEPVLWLEFLEKIFRGDVELIGFVQRLMGSALPGEVIEHLLAIFYGGGANGKSVLIETILASLGEYAMKAPAGLLMASRGERHPTELADLFGKRLVAITETGDGQRLDERLVKETSGGDTIRARRMREDFWQFKPSHLSVLVTNHKPVVRGTDNGIWRRLRLVPFTVTIPEAQQDKRLPTKLLNERGAILRWMVQGCVEWQRSGLQAPPQVMAATEEYRGESDTFGQWFDEHLKAEPSLGYMASVKASAAFASYKAWCEEIGERNLSNRRFGERMAERITGKRVSNGTYYEGISWIHRECVE